MNCFFLREKIWVLQTHNDREGLGLCEEGLLSLPLTRLQAPVEAQRKPL